MEKSYEYTFDYGVYRNFDYACNNNLSEVTNDTESLKYELKYDDTSRITSYKTTNSYLHDYTLTYSGNTITITGIINKNPNTTITIETNETDLVTKITRNDNYSIFEYDGNGNLTKAKDFSNSNELLHEYEITYDTNPNPFYGQFKSNYLEDNFANHTHMFFLLNLYNKMYNLSLLIKLRYSLRKEICID